MRILAPFILRSFTNKMQKKFKQQFNQQYDNQHKKEGEVTIEREKKSSTSKNNDVGDYVDFEEVEE
jgi:hypothetical protein